MSHGWTPRLFDCCVLLNRWKMLRSENDEGGELEGQPSMENRRFLPPEGESFFFIVEVFITTPNQSDLWIRFSTFQVESF